MIVVCTNVVFCLVNFIHTIHGVMVICYDALHAVNFGLSGLCDVKLLNSYSNKELLPLDLVLAVRTATLAIRSSFNNSPKVITSNALTMHQI